MSIMLFASDVPRLGICDNPFRSWLRRSATQTPFWTHIRLILDSPVQHGYSVPIPVRHGRHYNTTILDPAIEGDTAEQNRFPLPCQSPVTSHILDSPHSSRIRGRQTLQEVSRRRAALPNRLMSQFRRNWPTQNSARYLHPKILDATVRLGRRYNKTIFGHHPETLDSR